MRMLACNGVFCVHLVSGKQSVHEEEGLGISLFLPRHRKAQLLAQYTEVILPAAFRDSTTVLMLPPPVRCRFGPCKQSAEEILELVAACNAERGSGMRRRVSDLRQKQQHAQQQQQQSQSKPQPLRSVTPSLSHYSSQSHASM